MKKIFILISTFLLAEIYSIEQTCEFNYEDWFINSYEGSQKSFYECQITKVELLKETEGVTTNTTLNHKRNDQVQSIWYLYNVVVKFIPNSIFTTFPNLEHFVINSNKRLEKLQVHFFTNANKLRVLRIYDNEIEKLDANIFTEAPNLEHINLKRNKITSVHRLTFNGLNNLQGVYLQNNKLSNLYPEVFTNLINLMVLDLTGDDNCLNQKYRCARSKSVEIEEDIKRTCSYFLSSKEVNEIKMEKETQRFNICSKAEEHQETFVNSQQKVNESFNAAVKITTEKMEDTTEYLPTNRPTGDQNVKRFNSYL